MERMDAPSRRSPRRPDALSRDRIVAATIELLDRDRTDALTMRALTAHLSTGRGAIYHHVSGMEQLLAAAADDVVGRTVAGISSTDEPMTAIRVLALGLFDAIDEHPWVGTQLAREPLQPAVLHLWKNIGVHLQRLGLVEPARSDAGSALVAYILGSAAQYAAGARRTTDAKDRLAYLETLATAWAEHDSDPIVREAASQLRDHDDREQFLAGVNIFLVGITAGR